MKIIFLFIALSAFFSMQANACGLEGGADGWQYDKKSDPYALEEAQKVGTSKEGFWQFKNPNRCGSEDQFNEWVFIEWSDLQGSVYNRAESIDFWQNAEEYFCTERDENGKPIRLVRLDPELNPAEFKIRRAQLFSLEEAGVFEGRLKYPTCP